MVQIQLPPLEVSRMSAIEVWIELEKRRPLIAETVKMIDEWLEEIQKMQAQCHELLELFK